MPRNSNGIRPGAAEVSLLCVLAPLQSINSNENENDNDNDNDGRTGVSGPRDLVILMNRGDDHG